MADELPGLEPDQADVNSQTGFEAALAARGLGPMAPLEPEGEAQDRLVPATQDLPGEEPQADVPAPEAGETEPEAEPEQDDAVAAFLAEHGGDPQAALGALLVERENAQGLIGRQGNELGDLRQSVARLEGRLDEQQAYAQQEPLPEPVTEELTASIETMFEENGAQQSMNWLAENRPDLLETGISVWSEIDPFQAGRFAARYDNFLQEEEQLAQQAAEPQQPQGDPILDQMRAREQFTQLTEAARNQLQISDEAWPLVREHVVPAFNDEATSPLIKNAIISPDPNTQFQGMMEIVRDAHGRAIAAQQSQAEAAAQQAAADEAEQRKLAATVTSGSLRSVPEGKPVSEMTSEERIALFKQSLLAPPSTSVIDGLTGLS